jgi:hypothetical protein
MDLANKLPGETLFPVASLLTLWDTLISVSLLFICTPINWWQPI